MSLLVGLSPASRSASVLHLAAMLARSAETDLIVTTVVPQTWPRAATARDDAEWHAFTRDAANAVLDHAAAVLGGTVPAEFVLHEASSARRGLLELAEARDAGMIVIGSSSAAPLGRIALGSESDALLHASAVPVAIAPRGFRTRGEARVGRVTAAYRGTDSSADLVLGAATVAGSVGAALRIASFAVVPNVSGAAGAGLDAERIIADQWAADIQAHATQLLSEVSALPGAPELAGTVIGIGDTWETAVDDVEWDADEVLVVGSSSLGPLARVFLGSNATKVVRHSPVPVVVVPRRALDPS
ncbi:universal stress protein [Microbacterium azadirachtae]|uniref:universal stress protein n=1 Tax=Microbacterium azadirachtae TaxID=582680 RepID=UPI0021D4CAB1|nr:universal stress protein [Microbacterium azadirachtae]UXW87322.1 universal stress protein [Microbacterium azadirachtae]